MPTPNQPNLIYPKRDLSAASVLGYTQNADGSYTAVSTGAFATGACSILGYIDSIGLNIDQTLLEAISIDAGFMNRVDGPVDASVVINTNRKRQVASGAGGASGADPGDVVALLIAFDLVQVIWAWNKATTHNDVFTFYGQWNRYAGGAQGIGNQKSSLALQMVDTSFTTVAGIAGVSPISLVRA